MIQRIQSVYLFMTTLLSIILIKGGILNFIDKSNALVKVTFGGIIRNYGGESIGILEKALPISICIILIPVLSLITIFVYKNRKIQLIFSQLVIVLTSVLIILSAYYSWHIIRKFGCDIVPGFKMVIPVLMTIFAFLAYLGVKKDDQLVKSYDRLR